MYFRPKIYLSVLRRALREKSGFRRRRIVAILLFAAPWLALFDALCLALDHVLFPSFRRIEIVAPVFIVGNARSGTTSIHRLLAADSEKFFYFRTWEILCPAIVQKKCVRFVGWLDQRWNRGRWAHRFGVREDQALSKARRMHDWRMSGPEEDGFLELPLFDSGTLTVLFPYIRELGRLGNLDAAEPGVARRRLRFYRSCLKRQLYAGAPAHGPTLLSKNPGFVLRLRSLLEEFPDARFICPVRNPSETIPSLVNMLRKGWLAMGCDPTDVAEASQWAREVQMEGYRYAFEVFDTMPEQRCAIVSFADLTERPYDTVLKIYSGFGIDASEKYRTFLRAQQAQAGAYRSSHRYVPGDLGPAASELRSRLGHLYERFGWTLPEDDPLEKKSPGQGELNT